MNNQQKKYIPVNDALPTKKYWLIFSLVAIGIALVSLVAANADIAAYNSSPLLEDLSQTEKNNLLVSAFLGSLFGSVIACAIGILLNIAFRHMVWRWRWVLIYGGSAFLVSIFVSFFIYALSDTPSIWRIPNIWILLFGLFRREFVNTHVINTPQSKTPQSVSTLTSVSSSNDIFPSTVCNMCGKKIKTGDKFCEHCGAVVNSQKETTAATPKMVRCDKCGAYYISAPRCSFCGDENKKYFPSNVIVREDTYISDNQSGQAFDLSAYHSALKPLLDEICPQTTAEAFGEYMSKQRKRVEFECKCFLSFLHHLVTREDTYSEINTDTYIAKFNIPTDERDEFNSRICDYLEIDMGGSTLPYMNAMLDKLEPSKAEKAKSCDAINYIYAFTIFCANAKMYVAKRDFNAFSHLSLDTFNNFFGNSSKNNLLFAIETYQQLKDSSDK
ncbi:MAG: zinc-ribbon domain-containing protein [Clostridia bacterium]|nr:zinc-ribbon domain-containing protein [Clostridia bacterium]